MFEFNKELLLDTISVLLEQRNVKIGALESEGGVSTGYISCIRKEVSMTPGLEFVAKAADILGASIDAILNTQLSELSPTEKYLTRFLKGLIKQIKLGNLTWVQENEGNTEYNNDLPGATRHPLYYWGYGKGLIELYLLSICNAFADGAALIGNSYKVEIKGSDLYIVNLYRWKNGEECRFTELWMVNESDKQFLSSSYLGQNLSSLVEELVESVSE